MSCNIQYGHVFCTTSSSFAGLKNPKTDCLTLANSHPRENCIACYNTLLNSAWNLKQYF